MTLFAIILMSFACACTTSKSVVSQNVDITKYEYVSVLNNDTYQIPAALMEYDIMLYDAVEESGLKLVSDWRIDELTEQQKSKLFMAKYGVNVSQSETIVTVNFIDYLTGRPIASCRGASSSLGISYSSDIRNAIKNAGSQIKQVFHK